MRHARIAKLGLTAGTTSSSLNNKTISVKVGNGTTPATTITFGGATGQVKTLDDLNAALNSQGAQASIDSNGKLTITTLNESGSNDLTIGGTATGTNQPFVTAGTTKAVIGGDGKTARDKLVNDFNNLLQQIDQTALDSGFNGVNLLSGDNLKVVFNEKNSSSLNVRGYSTSSASLGLTQIASADFVDAASIAKVLLTVDGATSTLKSQASTFGSNLSVIQNRQDFTKNMVNILDTGSANLVNADMNEEAANSQALSTRNSLGISALSLANQAQQGILQLLR